MKKIPCSYDQCGDRRIHHERPDVPRGTQLVEVPDDKTFGFCSMTCALLGGYMRIRFTDDERCKRCFVLGKGYSIAHGPDWICDRPEVTEEQYQAEVAKLNAEMAAFKEKYGRKEATTAVLASTCQPS